MKLEVKSQQSSLEEKKNSSETRYEKVPGVLASILEEIYDFHIPEETLEAWKDLSSLSYHVDELVDRSEGQEQERIIAALCAYLETHTLPESVPDILEEHLEALTVLREKLPPEKAPLFERSLRSLLKSTYKIKSSSQVKEAVKLTLLEGQLTAKLYAAFLPAELIKNENYQDLLQLLSRLGRIGNSVDTAVDLPEDVKNNQIQISPGAFSGMAFMGAALSQGMQLLRQGKLTPASVRKLYSSVQAVVKDKG